MAVEGVVFTTVRFTGGESGSKREKKKNRELVSICSR